MKNQNQFDENQNRDFPSSENATHLELKADSQKGISLYWRNRGKTLSDRRPGKTFQRSDGVLACDQCCFGDRCDERGHFDRESCPYCLGTGINAAQVTESGVSPALSEASTASSLRPEPKSKPSPSPSTEAARAAVETIYEAGYLDESWIIDQHKLAGGGDPKDAMPLAKEAIAKLLAPYLAGRESVWNEAIAIAQNVCTLKADSMRFAAEDGISPAYAEDIELCQDLSARLVVALTKAAARDRSASPDDDLVDEVQKRTDAVVDAAVAWCDSGEEGVSVADSFEKAEALSNAVYHLKQLRSPVPNPSEEAEADQG